ncbi:MAG: hypothetical protein J6L77_08660 [Coprococcus sp.]|nr:hypothetical protein [Coprococcus sp.]
MKRLKRIGLIVLVIILVITVVNRNRHVSKNTRDKFLKNLDDCNIMAEIYYKEFRHYGTGIQRYSNVKSGKIYCYDYSNEIVLSDEEIESCQKAWNAYFEVIGRHTDGAVAYDTFVSFCMEDGRSAIVYSEKDKRPSYINYPDDGFKPVIVEKITDHWYYVYYTGWFW